MFFTCFLMYLLCIYDNASNLYRAQKEERGCYLATGFIKICIKQFTKILKSRLKKGVGLGGEKHLTSISVPTN